MLHGSNICQNLFDHCFTVEGTPFVSLLFMFKNFTMSVNRVNLEDQRVLEDLFSGLISRNEERAGGGG